MATSARDNLITWLRDAHAMEEQAETMLASQYNRLENYPELRARIGEHLEETRQHAALLTTCLDRLEEGTSSIKVATGKLTAMAQGIAGVFAGDEVVKGSLASYTFEHMEIASYRILIAAAESLSDQQTAEICRQILEEEVSMADWLEDNLGAVTLQFLSRDESGLQAKR